MYRGVTVPSSSLFAADKLAITREPELPIWLCAVEEEIARDWMLRDAGAEICSFLVA